MTMARRVAVTGPDRGANRLLGCLTEAEYAQIAPVLEKVELVAGDVLTQPDRDLSYAYFPCAGTMVLLFIPMADSKTAQAAVVNDLGVVGLAEVAGDGCGLTRATVAIGGDALRIRETDLREAMNRSEHLRQLLGCCTEALVGQLTQNAACNAVHSVDRRVARWILTAHDCCVHDAEAQYGDSVTLPLKQEFLGDALGVQRTTVTLAAKRLQEAGCVRYTRGRIRVIDRAALEDASCECHRRLWQLWRRLLPNAVEDWRPDDHGS